MTVLSFQFVMVLCFNSYFLQEALKIETYLRMTDAWNNFTPSKILDNT